MIQTEGLEGRRGYLKQYESHSRICTKIRSRNQSLEKKATIVIPSIASSTTSTTREDQNSYYMRILQFNLNHYEHTNHLLWQTVEDLRVGIRMTPGFLIPQEELCIWSACYKGNGISPLKRVYLG
ncbi:unnamed protein product [Nezara viridula]|uniref:Uncharacterized protein n=1 Tax=Nezara viridula TaxID=85310 RepID=A0A9P0E828_NEZVI|nr:unnamed protein product [Nezara viridula]